MPVYKLNGEIYDIPDDVVAEFEKDNPNATVTYQADGDEYEIPVSERESFLNDFPDATTDIGTTPVKPKTAGSYKPSTEDMAGFMSTINNAGATASGSLQHFDKKAENLQKRTGIDVPKTDFGRVNLGQNRKVTTGQQRFNLDTGQMDNTYVTEQGNEYESRELADLEQNAVDDFNRRQADPLGTDMEDANQMGRRLDARIAELESKRNSAMRENNGFVYTDKNLFTDEEDEELQNLKAAKRQNDLRITTFERQKEDHETKGVFETIGKAGGDFFKGMYDTARNPSVFSFGITDLADMTQLYKVKQKIDAAKEKGVDPQLTESEESLLQNTMLNNYAQQQYGENRSDFYGFGQIAMQAIPFVGEFFLTGGFKALSEIGARYGAKKAADLALKGWKATAVKNLGVVAGDLASGWAMANTTGAAKTAADILDRHIGDVYIDKDGQYYFDDGKSLAEAVYEGQLVNTFEYYTEKLGDHLNLGNLFAKGAEKYGLSKLSKAVTFLSGSKTLNALGVHDYPSEVIEEWANLGLNAAFGLDNNFSIAPLKAASNDILGTNFEVDRNSKEYKQSVFNGKTQKDIVFGMFFSLGVLNAPRYAHTGYTAAQYKRYQHKVDTADANAASVFGADNWQMIKEQIDNCTNEDMADLMQSVSDGGMTKEQKEASARYAANLMTMRGYNSALMAMLNGDEEDVSPEAQVSNTINQSYTEGYDTETPDELKQFNNEAQEAGQNLPQYGEEFAKIVTESQSPVETLDYLMQNRNYFTDEQIAAAADYFQKRSRIEGAMDGALDRIDTQVEQANAEVRGNMHQASGQVVTAQIGDGAYYIIGGDIVNDEETGMPVVTGTGGAVVVKDALTGEVSVKSPQELTVTSMTPSDDMIRYNEEVLRQQLMKQADDDFTYGSPANEVYQLEDTVTLNDGDGNTIEGQVVMMPNAQDGVYVIQTPDNKALQFTADQLNRMIVAHNGMEVQRASQLSQSPTEQVSDQDVKTLSDNQQQTQQEQSSDLDNAGAEASAENGTGADNAPATALSRIPILTDEKGQPVLKKGRPQYQWHKASTEDAAAALIETTGGDMVMARDTASDLVKNAQAGLEKIRKQKPKGDDPIEIAESRMEIKRQEEEQQAVIKQWQDVNQAIQKQMRDEAAARQAEIEAAKSEEQRQREAAEAEERKKRQEETDRQRIREAIERDHEKRNKVYEALSDAREEMADDVDAFAILSDTEPRSLEEWVSSLLRPHSMLWQNASESETGLQSELGLKRNDMQRMMSLLGTKESGAKPFNQVVLDIHEGLPEAMKDQYTDQDVRNTLLNLFNEGSSTRMMNLTEENRIAEAREAYQENLRRAAEYEMEQWAEAYHLTPAERETYENFLSEDYFKYNAALNNEQEFINKIIADEEQNSRGQEMDLDNTSGTAGRESEGGESQVQGQSAEETAGTDQDQQQPEQGAETGNGEPSVPDTDVPGREPIREQSSPSVGTSQSQGGNEEQDPLAAFVMAARNGDKQAQNRLNKFGIKWEKKPVVRFVAQGEVDNILNGGRYEGRFGNGRVDVTNSTDVTTAATADYRITFKDELDWTLNDRLRMKNEELGDGYIMDGYSLDDVSTIEKRNEDGTYTKVYDAKNPVAPAEQLKPTDLRDAVRVESPENGVAEKKNSALDNTTDTGKTSNRGKQNDTATPQSTVSGSKDTNNSANLQAKTEKSSEKSAKEPKRLVSDEKMEELRKRLLDKLNNLNAGIDPEMMLLGAMYAVGNIERGVTKFADYAKKMVTDLGDKIRPYLKAFYNTVRDMPEAAEYASLMDDYDTVSRFDVYNFDKQQTPDALTKAEQVVKEQNIRKQAKKIKQEQPDLFAGDLFGNQEETSSIGSTLTAEQIAAEEAKVDTNPTEAQKEAGNYQKGHIKIDGYDITIENPKGSIRRGTDANGKPWETEMHNTYGYIRGTEGVDGDHIDVFLSDNPTNGSVYVVDQINPETGEFDEHKVMYGFGSEEEAREAYLANYSKGWKGLGNITEVSREDFKKWIESSHRKTKPFREYAMVKEAESKEKAQHLQSVKDRLAEYLKKYRTLAPVEIIDIDTNEEYQSLKDSKDPVAFDPETKKILIFANNIDEDYFEEGLFHESVHRGLQQYYGEGPIELAEEFWKTESPDKPDVSKRQKEAISKEYAHKPEDIKEEYFVHLLSHHMKKGSVDRILSRLSPEHQEIVNNILHNIGYDTAEETKRRTGEETKTSGSPENPEKSGDGRRVTPSSTDKIEDVGEEIAGARKDLSRKIAQSLDSATKQTLAELPFSKAYKKPDLKKAVEEGALRESDAVFYDAFFSSFVDQNKPRVTKSDERRKKYNPGYKTDMEKWVDRTHQSLQTLKDFVEADEQQRDRIIEALLADKYPFREQELSDIEKRKEWNKDRKDLQWGDKTTPNPLWITYEVMKRLDYTPGDKLDIPFGILKADSTGTQYSLYNKKNDRNYYTSPKTVEEGIDAIVWLARLKRGDSDIQFPVSSFYTSPTKSETGENGKFRVIWGSFRNPQTRDFDSKEEAEAFAKTKKTSTHIMPLRDVVRRFGYKVMFRNPLTGERYAVNDKEFDTDAEAMQYLDENYDEINSNLNDILSARQTEKENTKKELTADDMVYTAMIRNKDGKYTYGVLVDKKYANNYGMPLVIKDGFATRNEAKEFAEQAKEDVFKAYKEYKAKQKAFVYFDTGADSRIGEDYRSGKDVTAEDFMNTFGFRGVQFGNWTNQADRQMAVNQAYDAFLDLAKLIGVSPKAISLNGELGIAFGARGSGNFAAHYEPGEIVINLTKTMGAGSLAHEWWHALDNYFARTAGERGGMVTDDRSLNMRQQLRDAFNAMLEQVSKSPYYSRSKDKGDYWGRMHEVTARLLAEWVDQELKKRGELNTFLSRGAKTEGTMKINYERYKKHAELAGKEVMPFEEYKKLDEAMAGSPYPSPQEVERFSDAMRNVFDVMQERIDEETGNVALYQKVTGNEAAAPDDRETALRDALIDMMRNAGVLVGTDTEVGQDVLNDVGGNAKTSKEKYFRTKDGRAYGYTYNGKIYIDPSIATSETPIHEYTHLWAEAVRENEPEKWNDIVDVLKNDKNVKPFWDKVSKQYPELTDDNDIAEEVLAQYSGKRGSEQLREVADEIQRETPGIFGKAQAVEALRRMKNVLAKFWKAVADMMGWKFTKAEEIADKVLSDLLNGVNPGNGALMDNGIKQQKATSIDDVAQQAYNEEVAKKSLNRTEAWQDSMISLKAIQDAIAKETGRKATGAENAYLFENRMHGRAKNMTETYDWRYYRPMLKAFNDFCKQRGLTQAQGMDYLIAKSGLERNLYYAFRDAAKAKLTDEINSERDDLEKKYARGRISEDDYKSKKQELEEREQNGVDDFMKDVRESYAYQHAREEYQNGNISYTEYLRILETVIRSQVKRKTPKQDADGNIISDNYYDDYAKDYSGLTETFAKEMYDDAQEVKKQAQKAIDPQEKRALWAEYDEQMRNAYTTARQMAEDAVFAAESDREPADKLWKAINAATKQTLKTSYESGLMDRNTYNKVRDMFDYYIPLRGWEEDKASDVYNYMGKENVFSPAVKKTWGRTSQAENPLAYIGNIAVSTILSGHRNQMKQHFLNYVMNNPTSLVSVSESWYENIAPEGEAPVWVLRSADTAGKSADEIAQIVNDFNEEMLRKQAEGKAIPVTGRLRLDVNATSGQKAEHVVEVQRAGHTYQLYINGDPKAAQALNGTAVRAVSRISDTYLGRGLSALNRSMATFFTSKNPAFVVSNLSRDLNMAGASVAIRENKEYNEQFIKNVAKVLAPRMGESSSWVPASKQPTGMMPSLMRKYMNGTLDTSNETERLFKEFIEEGGETGFVNMLSVDSFKEKMKKEISQMNGSSILGEKGAKETTVGKGLRMLGDIFEFYNRCAEDATRFIVYMTSRQMGKSLEDSIADAKDVTLNFNRKGTGAMGNAEIRDLFIFVNPAIQALANMYKMMKGKPLRFGAVTAGFIAGGALMPVINQWLLNMFGDDDDKDTYWNLPPWVRKNNLVLWIPGTKNFLTIPLAQEFRVFYGVGEMITSAVANHTVGNMGLELVSSVADLVPINPTGNGGNLMVDLSPTGIQPLIQIGENIDFTGRPLWKENQGNKFAPMYTKAYVSTPTWMVILSEKVNDATGGNEGKKGWVEQNVYWGDYLNNPAVWNHLLQGYFGGMYNTISKGFDVVATGVRGEVPKIYQTPVINRFLNRPVERDNAGVLGEEYYNLINERDRLQYELRTWQKKAADGEEGAQKHVDEILSSDDYKRSQVISHYEKIMKDLKPGEKAATNDVDKDLIKQSISNYKQQLMEELTAIDDGKDPLEAAVEKFDDAKTFSEKNTLRLRIQRLTDRNSSRKPKPSEDEVKKALSYSKEEESEERKTNDQYLQLATGQNIRDDARIRTAKKKIKEHTDEFKRLIDSRAGEKAGEYRQKHLKYFKADDIIKSQERAMKNNQNLLGQGHDAAIMKQIEANRNRMLKAIEGL